MDMTFNQIATVLNAINSQMTGATGNAAIDTSSFVTQAQTMLRAGYDPLVTAISQVLTKTIFSERPYKRKFGTLRTTPERYGNHTRKINIIDNPVKEDDRFKLVDGQSIDPWVVQKPKTIQTNLYGANVFERQLTIYKDQLDNAFRGVDEFGSFVDLMMTNLRNTVEQDHENRVEPGNAENCQENRKQGIGQTLFLFHYCCTSLERVAVSCIMEMAMTMMQKMTAFA